MTWSVRDLIDFSHVPGINEAYEGTWASGDLPLKSDHPSDASFGLDWLEDDPDDENNNRQISTGTLDE